MSYSSRIPGTALIPGLPEPNVATIREPIAQQTMSVPQFIAIVRAYWLQIAVMTIGMIVFSLVLIKLLPKTFTATSTIIVSSDVKDPLAGRDFPAEMINSYVSTQMELITSPIVLVPVIQKLHLMQNKSFAGNSLDNSDAHREDVQKKLAASISVERGTGGQLIYVSASSRKAAEAAEIANAVVAVYIEQDQRRLNEPAAERARRYTEELAELRGKTSLAQEKVTAFGKDNGIGDLSSASVGLEEQALDTLHTRLLETQNLRRTLEAKQVGLPTLDGPTGSTTVLASKTLLDTQLAQLAQLSSTYGPQHPKVRDLNAQIALTRQSLADEKHALTSNTESQLAQAKELEHRTLQAIADQEAKVAKVRQAQAEGNKLILELESAKAVYKQALDGFDQIMFQAVANHANVSVVTLAVPPLHSTKPNKLKLAVAAIVLSVGFGVAGPLGYGLFIGRRLRCRDDMERDFGITVLAQLEVVPALAQPT